MAEDTLKFPEFTRRFVLPMWGWYAVGFILLAVVNVINLEIPELAKAIVNALSEGNDGSLSGLQRFALAIIGLGITLILTRSLSRITVFWPGRRLETDTKSYLFERVLALPETFFFKHGLGDLISRLSNDVGQLRAFYAFGLLQVLNVLFLTVFTLSKMVSIHPTLTGVTLLPLLISFVVVRVAMPKMHILSRANQDAQGTLTSKVTEAFGHVHVIQANAVESSFMERMITECNKVYDTNIKLVFLRTCVFPLMACLATFSQLGILYYGGHEVIAGRLTVGDILAFNVYVGLLTFPLSAMGIILSLFQRAKTALERLSDIDRTEPEGAVKSSMVDVIKKSELLLSVEDLTFSYPEHPEAGVFSVSFDLKPQEKVGIYGPIGSGKTTLFNLLVRLQDPTSGIIRRFGQDIQTVAPQDLRREFGYAMQGVHLFSATIRENLAFGLIPSPTEADLVAALKGAQIYDEIMRLKDGIDTEIGERGLRLSGGQKQRLALARLFLRRPALLILDDTLSAVDQLTETALLDHIYSLGGALLLASHRASALKRCDKVLIFAEGRIIYQGPYADGKAFLPQSF